VQSAANRNFVILGGILFLTLLLWSGVRNIEPNGDDYQYLHSMAPITGVQDLVKPFYSMDCNTSVFRPISNMTMVFDFLVFGWWGGGFHLTNLFFHLLATAIFFFFARKVFGMEDSTALIATFLFGILGAHDGNMVTSTLREDSLPAIFGMLALIAEKQSDLVSARKLYWKIFALVLYFAATLSKEVAIMFVPLVALLFDFVPGSFNWRGLRRGLWRMLPYLVVTLLYYLYHAHFTSTGAMQSQPLQSEGARSPIAFVRNFIYGIAYMLLPLNLKTATTLLRDYKLPILISGVVGIIFAIMMCVRFAKRKDIFALYKPAIFLLVTMGLVCLSFERWRVYTPSLGIVTLIAILGVQLWKNLQKPILRYVLAGIAIVWVGYHVQYGTAMVSNAVASTRLLTEYKNQLGALIAPMQSDSLDITVLDLPAKLGSISVLQIGLEDAVLQGVAEQRHLPGAPVADVRGLKINCNAGTDIYALDESRGFRDVTLNRISNTKYDFEAPRESATRFIPDQFNVNGVSWRDRAFQTGDTIIEERATLVIEEAQGATATKMRVILNDSMTVPILFRNNKFELLQHSN
jgi:hypothetical protein